MDYLAHADIADSTKAMRCAVFTRDLDKTIGNLLLTEITKTDCAISLIVSSNEAPRPSQSTVATSV